MVPEVSCQWNKHTDRYRPTPEKPEVMGSLNALLCWIEQKELGAKDGLVHQRTIN